MSGALSREEVKKVAVLARLKLSDTEIDSLTTQMGKILGFVESLNEVQTDGVEPMVHAMELRNVFREDQARPSLPREEALKNAPKTDGKYFLVPQIIDAG
ncbi:MAG: Asp-tRNA(Asn)/Glu-tRNA(Gln) amidotransferase subunit GatC [Planctomycetaceae bacterium]|nr:Asp-tRNA(Asn)/Glu-tRNA(Gln) amidotransferase subunit GatC [Planctomycetaceae bacterium]